MSQQDYRYLNSHSIAQNELRININSKDHEQFELALLRGVDVNERDRTEEQCSSFEECLKMKGMAIFIRTCLEHGAHVASFNPITNKYPIHLAAETCDVHNLQELVKSRLMLIDQKFNGCTALFMLFEMLTAESWENVFECIKVLLGQGADINTTGTDEKSPIALLVSGNDNWRKTILEYCLKHYYVDVQIKVSSSSDELVREVIKKHFPDVTIPVKKENISIEYLSTVLLPFSEIKFLEAYRMFRATQVISDDDLENLLYSAIASTKLKAINVMLEPFLNNGTLSDAVKTLSWVLCRCCENGNAQVLEWCLNSTSKRVTGSMYQENLISSIDELCSQGYMTMVSQLIQQMDPAVDMSVCPFFKCMQLLLNDDRIDIDKKSGFFEGTALHYAAKNKLVHAQRVLLAKGASLGVMDLLQEMPIRAMDPIVLENHLDSCVFPECWSLSDKTYQFQLDLSNFVKPSKGKSGQATSQTFDEMLPILRLSQSHDKKHLLQHPVILTILLQKWTKLKYFFYANLFLCAAFSLLYIVYVTMFYGCNDAQNFWYSATYGSLIVLIIFMGIRELFQCCLNVGEYLRSVENYVEISLIVGATYVLYLDYQDEEETAIPALIAILPALNLTLLVGSLPMLSLSTHMVMLKTVSKNFLECFLLYAIILVTFAASFYTLFRGSRNSKSYVPQSNELLRTFTEMPDPYDGGDVTQILKSLKQSIDMLNKNSNDEEASFDTFENFPLSVVKTIVMLIGELNVSDIPLEGVIPYIILVIFVFFVPIVLSNLINGLAISDIAAIKAESELIGLVQRVSVLYKLEAGLEYPKILQPIAGRLSMLRWTNRFRMFSKMDVKPNICIGWTSSKYSKKSTHGAWLMLSKPINHQSGTDSEDTDMERSEHEMIHLDDENYRRISLKMDDRTVKYMLNIVEPRQETVDPIFDRLIRLEQGQADLSKLITTLHNDFRGFVDSIQDKLAQVKPPTAV